MTELETRICSAWRRASEELGLRFTAPVVGAALGLASPGISDPGYLGLVHHFGASGGMLICALGSHRPPLPAELKDHYQLSELGDVYATYQRELFVETLDDWGWHGPADRRPPWYTGQPPS